MTTNNRTLAQTLAVQSQIHLPGTVGRLLKQIRDLERVAPLFVKAGLVRAVARPNPINTRAAGIPHVWSLAQLSISGSSGCISARDRRRSRD
jgi:hypothetical protein